MRFIGVRDLKIKTVSSSSFMEQDLSVFQVPEELDHISNIDLINDYIIFNNIITPKYIKKSLSELRVAYITNWKQTCGIAAYSYDLISQLSKTITNYKLFIEHTDFPLEDFNIVDGQQISNDNIKICWTRA